MSKFYDWAAPLISSILMIIFLFIVVNSLRDSGTKSDIKETNKRIDALFHYVLTKQSMEETIKNEGIRK